MGPDAFSSISPGPDGGPQLDARATVHREFNPDARVYASIDALRNHIASLKMGEGDHVELDLAAALLDTARVIVLLLDFDRKVHYANAYFTELTGWTMAELEGQDWLEVCVPEEDRARVGKVWKQAVDGTPTTGNVNGVLRRDGTTCYVKWFDRTVMQDGRPIALLAIGHDVTEQHSATLSARREAVERTLAVDAIFGASNVLLAYLDRNFDFIQVNQAYAEADSKTPEAYPGRGHFELYPNAENEAIFERVRDTGVPHTAFAKPFEYANSPDRGLTHWDWTLTPVFDVDGGVSGLVLALTDVTERIEAMEELDRSRERISRELAEKEVLLREVHHRVKNNLQIISSLLYLQSSSDLDEGRAALLAESRGRVQAIALVHEILYSSDDIGQIDVGRYLGGLATAARDTYEQPGIAVEIDVRSSAPPLDMGEAVPCGLIVIELIGNAFKHAFVGRSHGRIEIVAEADQQGLYDIIVRDDGRGMDPTELESVNTLGMTLVRRLTEQLGGRSTVESSDAGTSFRLRFRPSEP